MTHAPLVLDVGGIGALRAEEISVEVRQVVVVALDALDQLPPAEPEATAGTHPALRAGDGGGRLVLADLAAELLRGSKMHAGGGDAPGGICVDCAKEGDLCW
jgi:hypothetical protein